jgi:hypothetical protein
MRKCSGSPETAQTMLDAQLPGSAPDIFTAGPSVSLGAALTSITRHITRSTSYW